MSNLEKRSKVPDPPMPSTTSGNLLSSVAPPTELPNFVTTTVVPTPVKLSTEIKPINANVHPELTMQGRSVATSVLATPGQRSEPLNQHVLAETPSPDKFSPVIPLSKGQPMAPPQSPEYSQSTLSSEESLPSSTPETDKLGDIMPGSGLFTWMKGAVSTGGILHKVAEKAKSSVDSMITTLDPQMKEYLNSGGDVNIVVASDNEVEISSIREAFQSVFGKATVAGYPAENDVTAAQPVGYAAACAAAKQRIAHVRSTHSDVTNNTPIVAIESFLHEAIGDRWYEISLLVLSQTSLGIELQTQSQVCAVPHAAVLAAREATPENYPHEPTGYSITIGSIMGINLQVPHTQWQEASTGVSRKETLLLASRSLAGSYKRMLAISAAEV